jgi:hypothetical protein
MSSTLTSARRPGHRHTSSADSAKFEDVLPRGGGHISYETFEADDIYFAQYPNNWAKIRSAITQPASDAESYVTDADVSFLAN